MQYFALGELESNLERLAFALRDQPWERPRGSCLLRTILTHFLEATASAIKRDVI